MQLKSFAQDKANHFVYGAFAAMIGAIVAAKVIGEPQFAWLVAIAAAALIGICKEAIDYWQNKQADLPLHVVERADIIATALGGVPVALPLLLMVV